MNGLITLRKRLALSQAEIGAAIGITQSTISQSERGDITLSVEVAKRLVQFARSKGIKATLDEIYMTDAEAA
ncbi:helix-turn-helix transcriptional regulator [Caballeronia sp. LZ032]|uniref:helix-turn-helix transcriptional regulator n=1 Tax=Caballeronia sp. LZ032 TaxID=3038565 RepID=UPI0028570FAD|nr:helix-turn-helix transcriptional regulator [Caballeronia sp. LZ032]MDR5881092.1 helix-turn-helix transcriptional regulator [Caballeronia sp. LZ032]